MQKTTIGGGRSITPDYFIGAENFDDVHSPTLVVIITKIGFEDVLQVTYLDPKEATAIGKGLVKAAKLCKKADKKTGTKTETDEFSGTTSIQLGDLTNFLAGKKQNGYGMDISDRRS